MRCPQGGDFAAPAGKVVLGRFQEEGQIAQGRVVRHSGERIKADTWYKLVGGEFKECDD